MNKKSYIAPMSEELGCDPVMLLGVSATDQGMGYGGVDEDGLKEPAARAFIYDDEEE